MVRSKILALAAFAVAISTAAQNSTNSQPGADAKTETSASAGIAAGSSQQPATSNQKPSRQASAAASGSGSESTSASAGAGGNSLNLASNTPVEANLVTALDAKHSKPGDKVEARTTEPVKQDGHVVLAKGTELVGHVTLSQARGSGNAESSLGMVFDNAVTKDGQQLPLHLSVQALAASATQSEAALGGDDAGMMAGGGAMGGAARSGGGLAGGAGGAVGGAVGSATGVAGYAGQSVGGSLDSTAGAASGVASRARVPNAAGQLTSTSSGVFGLEGMKLTSAVSNSAEGSVVSSTSRNVHLESGTGMVLSVMK
jgi:hypothetical protein